MLCWAWLLTYKIMSKIKLLWESLFQDSLTVSQQKTGYKRFTEHVRTHLNKTQFPPQSVSLIRKLPLASYPSPSEGRQNENHNHRKLTNLITWTTALSNSMKQWAMLCRATQDRRVMVESPDKMWVTFEGDGKPFQYSCLENPMNSMNRQKDSSPGQ